MFRQIENLDCIPPAKVIVKVDQVGFVDLDFGTDGGSFARVNLSPEQARRIATALVDAALVAEGA